MSRVTGLLAATALVLAGLVVTPAFAQEKVPEGKTKQIDENDKIRVVEVTYQPGEGNASAKRPMRVVYAIKGGTLERTYADGTKETTEWKAGETKIISEARPYSIKNVGKTVIQYLVVFVK